MRSQSKELRGRWSADQIRRYNVDFIRSLPKSPVWPMDALRSEFSSHEVDGASFVDLRGFTFHALRHVHWARVDMRFARFVRATLGPGMIGTGSIGSVQSTFSHCVFDEIDAADANINGTFDDCSFRGAAMRLMSFFVGVKLRRCSFAGAVIDGSKAINGVRFEGCDFSGAKMRRCRFEGVSFENCLMDGVTLDGSGIIGVTFDRCSMKDVSMKGVVADRNTYRD